MATSDKKPKSIFFVQRKKDGLIFNDSISFDERDSIIKFILYWNPNN